MLQRRTYFNSWQLSLSLVSRGKIGIVAWVDRANGAERWGDACCFRRVSRGKRLTTRQSAATLPLATGSAGLWLVRNPRERLVNFDGESQGALIDSKEKRLIPSQKRSRVTLFPNVWFYYVCTWSVNEHCSKLNIFLVRETGLSMWGIQI